ncbi:hypothetical protein SUDANB176_00364 [Streptomyces sp. enrichment culture]
MTKNSLAAGAHAVLSRHDPAPCCDRRPRERGKSLPHTPTARAVPAQATARRDRALHGSSGTPRGTSCGGPGHTNARPRSGSRRESALSRSPLIGRDCDRLDTRVPGDDRLDTRTRVPGEAAIPVVVVTAVGEQSARPDRRGGTRTALRSGIRAVTAESGGRWSGRSARRPYARTRFPGTPFPPGCHDRGCRTDVTATACPFRRRRVSPPVRGPVRGPGAPRRRYRHAPPPTGPRTRCRRRGRRR